ncbi:MAG TPA: NAD(P)H-hydrate dehydratase [Bacteroidota bacterium]|nr:NAD(P)H-hydrate dehydratase [Bacteroidota bacterium]
MDIVVTSAGMQACDRYAMDRLGVPSSLLMENAGRNVAESVAERLSATGCNDVTILCGKGNNGGDGFVAARHLLARGVNVRVVVIGRPSVLKGVPLKNFTLLRRLKKEPGTGERLEIVVDPSGRKLASKTAPAVIVDALFGTGFHGKLSGGGRKAVEWINRQKAPTISVDVPSGLDADNGAIGNICVKAEITVTMGLLKAGLLIGRGPAVCGRIVRAGLGTPPSPRPGKDGQMFLIGDEDARDALPRRPFDAHKHSVGKILVLAGSVGFTGAAALTALSALKSGAGAVILATPASVYPILARKLTEVMVKPVNDTTEGAFCEASMESLEKEIEWADIIIAGPGIGVSTETGIFIKKLLKTTGKRFLLDADGLTHIARNNGILGNLRKNRCILTPHTGEFSRLTGVKAAEIENNRVELPRKFAQNLKITLILKGAPTVTADSGGRVFINPTGNRGMATAGMGDVLAGVVGALWAESGDEVAAAYAGAYLHGQAGNRIADRIGYRSVTAGDVLNEMPHVLADLTNKAFH